jgi:hypothetical protein
MLAYLTKLEIWDSNYGRDFGWIVERDGREIAILSEPRNEEMFWDSYTITITTNDPNLKARMATPLFWENAEMEKIVIRSKAFGLVAPHAFPAMSPLLGTNRLLMRGVYLPIGTPTYLDRFCLAVFRAYKKCGS